MWNIKRCRASKTTNCRHGARDARALVKMFCGFLLVAILWIPLAAADAGESVHSIQIGSYPQLADAEAVYASLEKNLPREALSFLRIEKIPPYFTIRIGKSTNPEELNALLPIVRKHADAALVRKVNYIEERIVKGVGGGPTRPESPSATKQEMTERAERPERPGRKHEDQDKAAAAAPGAAPTPTTPSAEEELDAKPAPARLRAQTGTAMAQSSPSCVTESCHQNIRQIAKPHAPVQKTACLACHVEQSSSHPDPAKADFSLVETGANLCYRCHEPMARAEVVHAPMREGTCTTCHLPHGGNGPALLAQSDDQRGICFKCHDEKGFQGEKVHGPTSLGACTLCHDPHQSKRKKLLKEKTQDSCLNCHDDFLVGMKKAKFIHPAITEKSCIACHSPHSSDKPHLLRASVVDLCLECHAKQADKYNNAKVKHQVLYDEHGCGNCHQTHFADTNFLLLKDEKELCFGCHGQEEQTDKPKKVRNIKKEIEGKKYQHGPVAKGTCNGCHDMHGTDNDKLLIGTVPTTLYAGYTPTAYDFCFACHDRKMLNAADAKGETEFRNGNRNLHYLHVVRTQKGRTCRSCHEPHASNAPKLMSAEGVPFGQWRVPVRFEKTDNGGSCLPGCHRRLEYDRHDPVNYSAPQAPTAVNQGKN